MNLHRLPGVLCCLLATMTLLSAADIKPASATMITKPGKEEKESVVWVHSHTISQLSFSIEENGAVNTIPADQVVDVRYDRVVDVAYQRAVKYQEGGQWDNAAQFFAEAATDAAHEWLRVDAYLRQAQCLIQAKKPAEAIAAYDQLLGAFPKTAQLPQALRGKGQAQLAAGDEGAALKTFDALRAQSTSLGARLGPYAGALAALGRAEVLAARKDHVKAAEELKPVLAKLDASVFLDTYGEVGAALGDHLIAAGRPEEALAVYDSLIYQQIPPEAQAAAHLGKARVLEKAGKKEAAFDAAVFALLRGGNQPALAGEARSLARQLGNDLAKDPAIDAEAQKQYRLYVGKL